MNPDLIRSPYETMTKRRRRLLNEQIARVSEQNEQANPSASDRGKLFNYKQRIFFRPQEQFRYQWKQTYIDSDKKEAKNDSISL